MAATAALFSCVVLSTSSTSRKKPHHIPLPYSPPVRLCPIYSLALLSQLMAAAFLEVAGEARATANLSQSNLVRVTGKRRRSPCSTLSDIVA